jgi:predicted unusual protein kinase regulating ubiquinone biosynthesis (AarF/ABC1/UbiB family)
LASLRTDDAEDWDPEMAEGEILEKGWEKRGSTSALRRNAEVWKFALTCVFKVLKPRKLRKKGATENEIKKAQDEAAVFIRDGLLRLGPTFVKLGQVLSTRTDVLSKEYIDVLKSLQDEVPAFSGARAKEIVSKELGKPFDAVFQDFSDEPLKAASLGQVHTAMYKGKKVAIKVQRAGLKELFDLDLKNLKKLASLLDKFDPKSDGADRNWVSIYEESERLLYLEIDYLNEANSGDRFAKDFEKIDYVRVPKFYRDVSTPRVLTMEFVESFKLTDFDEIERQGLDRKELARKTADAFLRQIVETSYFHCGKNVGVGNYQAIVCRIRTYNVSNPFDMIITHQQIRTQGEYRCRLKTVARSFSCINVVTTFSNLIFPTIYYHSNLCVDKEGNLVYYDFGMMDELKPNVRNGFRTFCKALFAGGPTIGDLDLAKNAKLLVDGVEEAGVLAKGADRLAVEKLARYFMRSFKDKQLGKKSQNIKSTLGTDLQTLTENNVFRFPSTFTFIFRAFASVDGIGKGLDAEYDIGKLAQPFIEKFTDSQKGYSSKAEKNLSIFSKATGLNTDDINTAVTSPRKIAYIEETLRSMENGALKIRVRSLENEKSLERMALTSRRMENLLLASVLLNTAALMARPLFRGAGIAGACFFAMQAFIANAKVKKFDKTQAKFVQQKFVDDE